MRRLVFGLLWLAAAPLLAADSEAERLLERAHQDRTIVYFLNPPETHSFALYHDYTASKEGEDQYLNVVRAGSHASDPSARILDTGEPLTAETLRGEDAEVVVVRFPAVPRGGSTRLRISETYTDPGSYRLEGDELVWDRSLGRPRNAVVLPTGFYLTVCSIPATVSETADGRIRLDFVNPRPDEIAVLVHARRRPKP